MPLDYHRDDAGKFIDPDEAARLVEKDLREELRVERYSAPENPDLIAFRVVDRTGKVRGFIGFEMDAMEFDLPARTLERVRRAAAAHPRPDLKLVG